MIVKYGTNSYDPFMGWLGSVFDDMHDFGRIRPYRTTQKNESIARLDDGSTEIVVPLPGVTEDGMDLSVENDVLTLAIESEKLTDTRRSFVSTYTRSWTLPKGTDTDNIEANLSAGLLTIRLPCPRDDTHAKKKIAITATK